MQAHLEAIPPFPTNEWTGTWLSGEYVYFDNYAWLGFALANYTRSEVLSTLSSLFAGDNIARLISNYYEQYAAILAGVSLMNEVSVPSTGSAIVSEQRLLIQTVPIL